MIIPHDIDTECIEPHRLNHLYPMLPIFDRNPRIMHLTSIYFRILFMVVAASINVRFKRLISSAVMQVRGHA